MKSLKDHNFISFEGNKRIYENIPVQVCSRLTQHSLLISKVQRYTLSQ